MRKRAMSVAVAAAVGAICLSGCTAVPVYNVTDASVNAAAGKSMEASQVRQAIMIAGGALGWRISDAGPGRLEGVLRLREHAAVVDIPYSASRYSIQFKSGENLKGADGTIHKNYNGWVQNLDRGIRAELART